MAMKLLIMNAFHLLCHLVPAHCSACKQQCFLFLQRMVQQVRVWLQWGQLNQCAYTVCNSMDTKTKHKLFDVQRYSIK